MTDTIIVRFASLDARQRAEKLLNRKLPGFWRHDGGVTIVRPDELNVLQAARIDVEVALGYRSRKN